MPVPHCMAGNYSTLSHFVTYHCYGIDPAAAPSPSTCRALDPDYNCRTCRWEHQVFVEGDHTYNGVTE
ncbi:hypothetical protein J6590_013121 [Homalodisca vitripennis]|nr:hypothetical protein J6590_013121 [Homalodisca vitripennis]